MYSKKLVLADGTVFFGNGFGADKEVTADLVTFTGMAGYQHILTDTAYQEKAVVMTYPLIGSYGMTEDDVAAAPTGATAILVKEHTEVPSNWKSVKALAAHLTDKGIVGVTDVDTRALAIKLRESGQTRGVIVSTSVSDEDALKKLG